MAEHRAASGARRRWSRVGWRYSVVLVVALACLTATIAYQHLVAARQLSGTVVDDYTGQPVAGASVVAGTSRAVTNGHGVFHVNRNVLSLRVTAAGYDGATITVTGDASPLRVRLRPNSVHGTVLNRVTGQPVPHATVAVVGHSSSDVMTDDRGRYLIGGLTASASLVVSAPGFAPATVAPGRQEQLDVRLRPDVLSGTVRDAQGRPVAGALVAVGTLSATTAGDGTYRIDGVPETGQVVVKAAGFQVATAPLDPLMHVDATLRTLNVRAVYADVTAVAQPAGLNSLVNLVTHSDLNAVVVDLKDDSGQVYYDTSVALPHQIGAVHATFDPRQLVATLHQHGIYVIARIAVFDDPILAAAQPNWAIQTSTGAVWHSWDGRAWPNPYRHEVWDYDTALAVEASRMGFDEVQLDAVQFPSSGPLDQQAFGVPDTLGERAQAIDGLLAQVRGALAATPTFLSVDVPAGALWQTGVSQSGLRIEDLAPTVDYICPTLYPATFPSGDLGFATPSDHPFEVVLWSLQAAGMRLPAGTRELRPWLQDFSQGPGVSYGANEVHREIQAADDFGAYGWMLWNSSSVYHSSALQPQ